MKPTKPISKRTRWRQTLAGVFLLIASGCVPSLHPLYTEKEIVFDRKLAGTWAPENSEETWQFIADAQAKSYHLVLRDGKKVEGEFLVRLVKLGPERFLDLYPAEKPIEEMEQGSYYKSHFILAHTFIRVDEIGSSLVMACLNTDWLEKRVREDPKAIGHSWLGDGADRLVLTAETAELQAFFLKHARTPDAFGEPNLFHRAEVHAQAIGGSKSG
jgi:hypothetical protein